MILEQIFNNLTAMFKHNKIPLTMRMILVYYMNMIATLPFWVSSKLVAEDGYPIDGTTPMKVSFQIFSCSRVVHLEKQVGKRKKVSNREIRYFCKDVVINYFS